jgi:D-alanyl-D-alanine carboxypeptidase
MNKFQKIFTVAVFVKNDPKKPLDNSKPDASNPVSGDQVSRRIYADYGAVLKAQNGSTPPPTMIFANENDCANWQSTVQVQTENIGGISIQLQSAAMKDLQLARAEAKQNGVDITPRGSDAARRSYADTVRLWTSRVNPGGRLDSAVAAKIRSISPSEQVADILKLESQGMNFSTDFSKSILYSVAAPGSSQHLSMLAFDVNQHDNSRVREILARHGWFQTVVSDLPHFTYLGVSENQLSVLGLKKKSSGGRTFWTP